MEELKNFFDADNPDKAVFAKLAKKYTVISTGKYHNIDDCNVPSGFKKVTESALDIVIDSEVGSRRVKSLLLQALYYKN